MNDKPASARSQLLLFFAAVAAFAAALGIHESIFNNFLSDTFSLSATARGYLEFPRELPGFGVVIMTGILAALPVTRLGVVGGMVFVLGMVGLVLFGSQYHPMILMMIIASAGMHLLQPVAYSVVLTLSSEHQRGRRMGQMGAVGTIGMILGSGFVWLSFDKINPQYRLGFFVAALLAALTAIIYALMHIPRLHQPRTKFVLHKKFSVYYLLEFLFGARKQIFITFGPWVLIREYDLPAASIAALLMTAAFIGIVFKPLAGCAIDRFGERAVMVADGLVLALVCLGYGYAALITTNPSHARYLACACFITDNLLFALGTARSTYLSRLTDSPQQLTSTLALGVSINHIASMTIPALAGFVWVTLGYEYVFLAAAVLALAISACSRLVPLKKQLSS